jgi:hypothetical protein
MNVLPTCAAVAVELAVVCAFATEVFTLYPPAVAGNVTVPRSSYVELCPAEIDCSAAGKKVRVPPVELVPHASAVWVSDVDDVAVVVAKLPETWALPDQRENVVVAPMVTVVVLFIVNASKSQLISPAVFAVIFTRANGMFVPCVSVPLSSATALMVGIDLRT